MRRDFESGGRSTRSSDGVMPPEDRRSWCSEQVRRMPLATVERLVLNEARKCAMDGVNRMRQCTLRSIGQPVPHLSQHRVKPVSVAPHCRRVSARPG